MIDFNKKISDTSQNLFLYLQAILWVISFGSIFFFEFCDGEVLLSKCKENQFIIAFFGAIIVNIIINLILNKIINSDRYQKIEQGKKINKTKGWIEIISSPMIAMFCYVLFSIIFGLQGYGQTEIILFSLSISISVFIDGIRRLRK